MTFPCRFAINLEYSHFIDILIFLIITTMLASGNATIAQPKSQWNGSFLYCQSIFCRWNGSFFFIPLIIMLFLLRCFYGILFYLTFIGYFNPTDLGTLLTPLFIWEEHLNNFFIHCMCLHFFVPYFVVISLI